MTVIKAMQKSVVDVQQHPNQNDTYDISVPAHIIASMCCFFSH